jgi:hypothetical protein
MERDDGGQTLDVELGQRATRPIQSFLAGGAVTISLASIESNWPPMTDPVSTPESSRTPGPVGGSNLVTGPGAGRKPRPASSPLMRNSKE